MKHSLFLYYFCNTTANTYLWFFKLVILTQIKIVVSLIHLSVLTNAETTELHILLFISVDARSEMIHKKFKSSLAPVTTLSHK